LPPELILASESIYRRELLARLGLRFSVISSKADETIGAEETAADAAPRLARAKANEVASRYPDALILAGDQLASFHGTPIGKPRDIDTARDLLVNLSGGRVSYYTAVTLYRPDTRRAVTHLDISHVTLRRLEESEIERYLIREHPLDCAGALKLEGLGISLCEGIETEDPTALIGLPLIATSRLLRRCGLHLP